jgi:hypothetical protein
MGKENKTRDAIDAVTGLVKAVPVYKDLVQPAAKEVGVGLQKTVQLALAPISSLVWGFDQIKEFVGTSVAKRLEKIPSEKIITPPAQIAGPALESLKYTGHENVLREMYGKLLATSMNADAVSNAHPSFVGIIKQLSPDEARICKMLVDEESFPVIDLRGVDAEGNYKLVKRHYSRIGNDAECTHPHFVQRYLDNPCRLGVIEVLDSGEVCLIGKGIYDQVENDPTILEAKAHTIKTGFKPLFTRGTARRTLFGKAFIDACVDKE